MSSPLRRSSRQHASSTAADREKEVFREARSPKDKEGSRKRRSEHKDSSSSKRDRRERSRERHREKHSEKRKHHHYSHEKREKEVHHYYENHSEREKMPELQRFVEFRVGKVDSKVHYNGQNSVCMAHTESQNTIAAAVKNLMMRPRSDDMIAEEGRDIAKLLDVDERELTVKEVIAKRMKNTTMRGLSRDLVKLITKEKDEIFPMIPKREPTNMDNIIDKVVSGAGSPPPLKGSNLRDALSQFLPIRPKDALQMNVSKESFVLTPTPFEPTIMWQAICQLPADYKGDDREFNVEGHRYMRLTSILNEDGFTVPVTIPVKLTLPLGGTVIMSLSDGFRSNRIVVKRRNLARWVYLVLRDANLLVHKSFLDLVLDYSGTVLSLRGEKEDDSSSLSALPFIPLTPPCDSVINACNGIKFNTGRYTKEYVYTPRGSKPAKSNDPVHAPASRTTQPSTSMGTSISDPDFLKNYLNGLGVHMDMETGSASGESLDKTNESTEENERDEFSLTNSRKVLLIADFDAGTSFEDLEEKYSVDSETVRSILRDRVRIIREEATQMSDRRKNRVRRTSYVGLNIMMWKFFKDCRDNGLQLNGKQLKEHAKTIANQLGLQSFKGSEGWLDAFKKRHKIDLRLMTGVPVNYEEDAEGNIICSLEPDCDDIADACSPSPSSSPSPQGTTENVLAQATALVSVGQGKPLDLGQLGLDQDSKANIVVGTPSYRSLPPPPSEPTYECQLISAIVRSAATHVPDKEVSAALDTIRCFILSRDPSLMTPFVELQTRIAMLATGQRDLDSFLSGEARDEQEDETRDTTDEDSISENSTRENGEITQNEEMLTLEEILANANEGGMET